MSSHKFISYINNQHSFTLYVAGISVILTYNVNFKQYFRMTVSAILFNIALAVSLKIKKIKLTINNSLIKLTMSFLMPLRIKKVTFTNVMKQLLKITYSVKIPKTSFTYNMKQLLKFEYWGPKIPKISFTATPILAQFIPLSTHDPKTLTEMDSVTLMDLDYTLVS
jgi:hypothetical protein